MDSALRCFQPMAAWVKDSLNLDARNVSMMAGRGWASAGEPCKAHTIASTSEGAVTFGRLGR
eukprot:7129764-Prymnesium_polylepis.1